MNVFFQQTVGCSQWARPWEDTDERQSSALQDAAKWPVGRTIADVQQSIKASLLENRERGTGKRNLQGRIRNFPADTSTTALAWRPTKAWESWAVVRSSTWLVLRLHHLKGARGQIIKTMQATQGLNLLGQWFSKVWFLHQQQQHHLESC